MKKIILLAALLLAATIQLSAVPAYRGLVPYTQPDGKVIQIRLHGDEYFHWTTDVSGKVIELGEDGYYHPVSDFVQQMRRSAGIQRRAAANAARLSTMDTRRGVAHGQKRFLVILVEFKDIHFTYGASDFSSMLNQNGYSVNGGTGSARDYYYENSHGEFEPIFDVYGPVRLNNNRSYYGADQNGERGNDARPEDAVKEGCQGLDADIDFTKYDNDDDGDVDLVFLYYAGQGQADGGPTESIWPHQWSIPGGVTLDGKLISNYACTNEIVSAGSLSGKLCGIGTACHEFGHAMGLPDFYDTDYETNGEAGALYDFSLMCGGAYNNNGRTPPYLNIEERIMLGWLEPSVIQEIGTSAQYTLDQVDNNVAYKIPTEVEGEYFVLETRGGQGWDKYIPSGLLIYHADKSSRSIAINEMGYSVSASELWNNWSRYNAINENGSHPCFYLIPSSNLTALNLSPYASMNDVIFPGSAKVTSYQPVDWNGDETAANISGIQYSSSAHQVSFTITIMNAKGISGYVKNTSGSPLQGVTIQVDPIEQNPAPAHGKATIRTVKPRSFNAPYVVQTDAQGHFEVDLQDCSAEEVELSAFLEGYITATQTVTLKPRGNVVNITMRMEGETLPSDLYKFDPDGDVITLGAGVDIMASVRFSQSELEPYAGDLIKSISFYPNCTSADLYVIIDFGTTRALTYKIPNPVFGEMITISLESRNLRIPDSGNVYFGYGVQNPDNDYPLVTIQSSTFHDTYYDLLNLNSSEWQALEISGAYYDLVLSVTLQKDEDPGPVTPPEDTDVISEMGFSYIVIPEDFSMTAGAVLPLKVVCGKGLTSRITAWYLDGAAITTDSITLTSGTHTLRTVIYYENSKTESIEVELEVQ